MPSSSSISGIVKDSSGQPISEAVVMIVDGPYEFPDIAAITNDDGVFHLSNIRVPGTYTLQVNGNDRMTKKEFSLKGNDSIEVVF